FNFPNSNLNDSNYTKRCPCKTI
ncbi:uncharacterized protein METZ01_LOCUS358934, partial [marine metagenome]